jgi:hypothetical protein
MQWQDLYQYFPGFVDLTTANSRTRRTFIWDRVQTNPYIITYYLVLRLRAFIEHVLRLLLGFMDL